MNNFINKIKQLFSVKYFTPSLSSIGRCSLPVPKEIDFTTKIENTTISLEKITSIDELIEICDNNLINYNRIVVLCSKEQRDYLHKNINNNYLLQKIVVITKNNRFYFKADAFCSCVVDIIINLNEFDTKTIIPKLIKKGIGICYSKLT